MYLATQFDYATTIDLLGLIVKTLGFLEVMLDRSLGERVKIYVVCTFE